MAKQEAEIDARVVPLIEEINLFPGVETFASCGGHRHVHESKDRIGQVHHPNFYVSFMIDPSPKAGWSLRLISWAAFEASCDAGVRYGAALIMWAPSPDPTEPPRFDLYGKISIDLLLKWLRCAREEHLKNEPGKNEDGNSDLGEN